MTPAEKLLHATDDSLVQFFKDNDIEAFNKRQQAIKDEIREKGLEKEVSCLIQESWARTPGGRDEDR